MTTNLEDLNVILAKADNLKNDIEILIKKMETEDVPTASDRWLLAYYPLYHQTRIDYKNIPWVKITDLALGNYQIDTDGKIFTPYSNANSFIDLVASEKKAGKKLILWFGGSGQKEKIQDAIMNDSKTLIDSFVEKLNTIYDGIDFNFEPLGIDDDYIIDFIKELKDRIGDKPIYFPLPYININLGLNFKKLEILKKIEPYVERFPAMTYAMWSSYWGWKKTWHTHATKGETAQHPTSSQGTLYFFLENGIPANKLGIGLGAFGYGFTGFTGPDEDWHSGIKQYGGDNWMGYDIIMDQYFSFNHFNYCTKYSAPYLSDVNGNISGNRFQNLNYLCYEDANSAKAKRRLVEENNFGGGILWTLSQAEYPKKSGIFPIVDGWFDGFE